ALQRPHDTPFSITILLMDAQHLPVPFEAFVYHEDEGAAMKYLVDLDRDGRAGLLIRHYDENASDPRVGPMCSGHWTTQLYRFRNLGVEEIRGTSGGITFPFVHSWTLSPHRMLRQQASMAGRPAETG